jgi:hypothetical protein
MMTTVEQIVAGLDVIQQYPPKIIMLLKQRVGETSKKVLRKLLG